MSKSNEDIMRSYFVRYYDKAMRNKEKAIADAKAKFLRKWSNAAIDRFTFQANFADKSGKVDEISVYFKNSDILSTDISYSTFLNDPR